MSTFLTVWALLATGGCVWLGVKLFQIYHLLVESLGLLLEALPEAERRLAIGVVGDDLKGLGVKVPEVSK